VPTSLAVFTRDLRLRDKPALAAAASSSAVVPAFMVEGEGVRRLGAHATRLAFLTESLADLDNSLRQRDGALVLRRGRWPDTGLALAEATGATAIHVADDIPAHAGL
jgi:deoxyribodipyrimidine photo-lyase